MDVMELRRRLMMGMASGGMFDALFEIVHTEHVSTITDEIIIPDVDVGCYYVVVSPCTVPQDGIDAGDYIVCAGQFVVTGSGNKRITNGTGFIYNKLGVGDYWSPRVVYVDSNTQISITFGSNRNVKYPANHDVLIIRVKN